MQRANFRLFSVSVMVKTLFSHWHRDALAYRGGSISKQLTTFTLNQISRAIGFLIRTGTLITWSVSAVLLAIASVLVFGLFILWPLLSLLMIWAGVMIVMGVQGI